jgi:transcriptional regulator with XRE-family HTH domain
MVARTDTTGRIPDPIDIEVGARIRLRRRWLGLSQSALAKPAGITFQQLQKYERGSSRVSASMLVKLAAGLQTSVTALVGEDTAASVSPVVEAQVGTPDAARLLAAFAAIDDGELRRALLVSTEGLARVATRAQRERPVRRAGRWQRPVPP